MKLEKLLRETLFLPDSIMITDAAGPGQIEGWDSLGHVTLISAIENSFGVSFDMEEIMMIESLTDIKRMLQLKGVTDF